MCLIGIIECYILLLLFVARPREGPQERDNRPDPFPDRMA